MSTDRGEGRMESLVEDLTGGIGVEVCSVRVGVVGTVSSGMKKDEGS